MITVVNTPDNMPAANSWGYLPQGNKKTLTQLSTKETKGRKTPISPDDAVPHEHGSGTWKASTTFISAVVPCQCRAKHFRSLALKAVVPTATTTQLFISILFANTPSTWVFCYSVPHSFSFPFISVSSSSSPPYSSQWPQIPQIFLLVQPEASFT